MFSDDNECDDPAANECTGAQMTCINTDGAYDCGCVEGYYMTAAGECEGRGTGLGNVKVGALGYGM